MDPLSDVLSLLKPRNYVTGALTAGEPWSLRFEAHEGLKCYSVVRGECWLSMEGVEEPVQLRAGACLLLPHGRSFAIASDLSLPSRDAWELLSSVERYNGVVAASPGDSFFLLGSYFALEGDGRFLLDVLPPIVKVDNELQRESMRWAVERLQRELRDPQPGGTLVAQQIAYTLLVEALRLHLADQAERGQGWLPALANERMRSALSSIHQQPARAWTVQELAHTVGMSRTSFAQTFKRLVGRTPMEYLTEWRMTLAAKRVQEPAESIASLAPVLGYKSESAFSAAFKRHWGSSPREYMRARHVKP